MSWRDELRPASFRGVSFFVDTSKKTLGRRTVTHEFPNRDTPFTEDMGRIAESFEIDGYVLGDDYFQAKRDLEEAFNKQGPAELIHPYYGSKFVQVSAVEFSESRREGAILFFTASFKEAGSNDFPEGINDKTAILEEKKLAAIDAAKADFDDSFSVAGLPGFAVDSARAKVAKALDTYRESTKGLSDIAEGAADLAFGIRSLQAETNDLLQAPSLLSARLIDSFNLLQGSISSFNVSARALSVFFDFGSDDPEILGETPIRATERVNASAFDNLMISVAVANASLAAQQSDYDSLEDATAAREEITSVIETILTTTESDDVYQAFNDLKAALVLSLPDNDIESPNIKIIKTDDLESSLVLAYDLFEDPEAEDDIIRRNKISNPAFIPAGTELEVIDDSV